MNRETELHFSGIPQLHKPRSKMVIPNDYITSMDAAQCIPIFTDPDIMPGDTVKMNMASVIRMATPLYPIFGNIVADIMFFFVPYRLVWDHWREFWGENTNSWYQTTEYLVPQIETQTIGFKAKSLADYMGLPTDIVGAKANQLPFRAYCKIWNDWFRSEALQQEVPFGTADTDLYYNTSHQETARGGAILNSNKLKDLFTGCLPSPQNGPDVLLPLGDWAPVYPRSSMITPRTGTVQSLIMNNYNSSSTMATGTHLLTGTNGTLGGSLSVGAKVTPESESPSVEGVYPINLWTDLSLATASTINNIRTAFQLQKFYEARANGNRYIEIIRNIFGVTSPDARQQRSEYLGGKRIPLNINTVLQTSSTDNTSPQGNTGAYSHTADKDEYFTHSFSEHGCLIGICTIRYYHSFNQGTPKGFTRRKLTDYYVPQFANLGNQPVYNKELYTQGSSVDDEVFGYQEAWANGYRYHNNIVTASMRTTYAQTMDSWHLADHYTQKPVLGSSWIQEDAANINRCLAVGNNVENQFFGDFYFRPVYTRVMPLYSIPGMLDHF